MKKFIKLIIILLFPLYLFSFDSNDSKVYKIAITDNWKPYYYVNKNGKPDGYAVELFEKIAKNLNIKYEYVIAANMHEILELFKENKVDIIPNIGISQNREDLFLFTQPTDSFFAKIYKRKDNKSINTKYDLQDKKVGVVIGNICTRLIDEKITKNKIYFTHYEELVSALKQKRIDSFCYPEMLINNELDNQLSSLPISLKEIKRGFGLSKEEFDLVPYLNEEITNLKLNGEFKKIHNKWFEKDSFVKLSKNETIFLIVSFFGITLTSFIIMFYFLSKKKWLLTKNMLIDEVNKRTRALQIQNQRLKKIHKKLKVQANKDALTKIYNRKFYNEKIKELVSLYKRYEQEFSFLIFDIDDFKNVNDVYGHDTGDRVLKELATAVSKHIRTNDYFFRVGGEEFIILLSDTTLDDSIDVAEKIRTLISKDIKPSEDESITISIGLTQIEKEDDILSIYKRADRLLYEAKRDGKNQVKFRK